MKRMIGIFDSGIGGLSILEKLREFLPKETFLYYADTKNSPYGNKDKNELIKICFKAVDYLVQEGCKVIVVACNTATTICMKRLKEKYKDIIFIGTVPAIKVASDAKYKNILVMATPLTIKAMRTKELIKDNIKNFQNIYLVGCEGLAEAIEKGNVQEVQKILKNSFKEYKDKNIDVIVLGCTHYPFIKNEISKEMPNIPLIDGAEGVAKEVKRQLEKNNLLSKEQEGTAYFVNSKML